MSKARQSGAFKKEREGSKGKRSRNWFAERQWANCDRKVNVKSEVDWYLQGIREGSKTKSSRNWLAERERAVPYPFNFCMTDIRTKSLNVYANH